MIPSGIVNHTWSSHKPTPTAIANMQAVTDRFGSAPLSFLVVPMVGAFFILDDPIFNGLAVSLIFGILVSTLLTLVVIPTLYYMAYRHRLDRLRPASIAQ